MLNFEASKVKTAIINLSKDIELVERSSGECVDVTITQSKSFGRESI